MSGSCEVPVIALVEKGLFPLAILPVTTMESSGDCSDDNSSGRVGFGGPLPTLGDLLYQEVSKLPITRHAASKLSMIHDRLSVTKEERAGDEL